MQKEIYTPMEKVLLKSALLAQALQDKKKAVEVAKLDLMLLKMEEEQGLIDGLPVEDWAQ